MKRWLLVSLIAGLTFSAIPSAKGDSWDKKTEMAFSAPFELPGIVLGPGTYVFKLLDSPSDREIVEVFNQDETRLYATILAIPDYRLTPAPKTVVRFEERATGSPEALKEWFYPGDEYGLEFVYPKGRALELAKATNRIVASMPAETAKSATNQGKAAPEQVAAVKRAPVTAVTPKGVEVEIAQAATPKPAVNAAATPASTQTSRTPATLPKTASNLPLILLVGIASLLLALSFRALEKRIR